MTASTMACDASGPSTEDSAPQTALHSQGSRAHAVEVMIEAAYSHPDGTPIGMANPATKTYFRAQQERAYDALVAAGIIPAAAGALGEPRGPFLVLPEHGLWFEGAPHDKSGRRLNVSGGGEGRGACRCGELSDVLPSNYQRKRWHREHKAAIVLAADETRLASARDMRDLTPRDIGRQVSFEYRGDQVTGDLRQIYALGDYGEQISLEVAMPYAAAQALGRDGMSAPHYSFVEEDTVMVAFDDITGYVTFPGSGTPS